MLSEQWVDSVLNALSSEDRDIVEADLEKPVSFVKFLKSLDTTILTGRLPFPLPVAFNTDQRQLYDAINMMGNGFLDVCAPRNCGATTVVRKYLFDALYFRQDYHVFYHSILAHSQAIMRSFFFKDLVVRPYSVTNPLTNSTIRWGTNTRGIRSDKLIMDNTFSGEDPFYASSKIVSINSHEAYPAMRITYK